MNYKKIQRAALANQSLMELFFTTFIPLKHCVLLQPAYMYFLYFPAFIKNYFSVIYGVTMVKPKTNKL